MLKRSVTLVFVLVAVSLLGCAASGELAQAPAWQATAGSSTLNITTLNIWPGAVPDAAAVAGPEADMTSAKDNLIAGKPLVRLGNVSVPTMTLYSPKRANSGAAVVVFPGGGYSILAIDLEGSEVCEWLNSIGVNCILLKYRVPNSGPYPKSAAALEDAQRALGVVRAHAAEWKIDSNRIGVLGFSAGGHLVAALSTHYEKRLYAPLDAADQLSCRPDFAVMVYPGYLADAEHDYLDKLEIHPTAKTPPTFLVQAEDDGAHVESAVTYFLALKAVKAPAELHVYAEGGHGYGLRRTSLPVTAWPDLVAKWLETIHMLAGK